MASRWDDDDRCKRNDGKGWRCRLPHLDGSLYCDKHHLRNLQLHPNAKPRARVKAAGASEANAKIQKLAAARGRVSDPPIEFRKRRGMPPKAKNVGASYDAGVSDPPIEKKKRPFEEDNLQSSFEDDDDDDKWEEDKKEEEYCRVSRVRSSYPSAEKKKRGRPPKKNMPVGRPPKRSSPTEIETEMRGEDAIGVLKLGQVWALSEESHGSPPRSYARIDRIVSTGFGFFVEVTPLVPDLILQEEILFAERGLPLACGLFKASQSSLTKKISAFTHRVPFEKDEKQSSYYRIFPKKGEIWAVYLQWDDLKKRSEYRLVEVVSDFSEEDGVNVFGLSGVEGKDGVYRRQVHEGFHLVRSFSRSFMPMFSHRVPASRIVEDCAILWKVELH